MIEKKPKTWEEFVSEVENIRRQYGSHSFEFQNGNTQRRQNNILFRGQSNSDWKIKTTLERKTVEQFHILKYLQIATARSSEIESLTGKNWHIPDFPGIVKEITEKQDYSRVHLPCYDYLVYLRHHAFPSPLLDWTESPFIAAYFAYIGAGNENPAVYCYIETPEGIKSSRGSSPQITVQGPYVRTHKRHFAQKAWYTVSTVWDAKNEKHSFCSHHNVFERKDETQDILIKIELPINIKRNAIAHLNDYNINHFTLFQSEDSLIRAIESRQFDFDNGSLCI